MDVELENAITKGSQYEDLLPGEHVVGLVGIKLKDFEKWADGKKTGEMEKKYQLSFRSFDNPRAWLNVKFRPVWNEKATMYQLLRALSERKLKIDSPIDKVFEFLKSLHNRWFIVEVGANQYGKISLKTNDSILVCTAAPTKLTPVAHFESVDKSK
jgi:hypothetical protein